MGRPAELADRPDPVEPVAAGDQHLGIAGEGRGIAADVGDARHRSTPASCRDLLERARRAADRARPRRSAPARRRRTGGGRGRGARPRSPARRVAIERQHRVARGFGGGDLARPAPARRCRARRTGRAARRAPPTASRTAATSAASPSAVAWRKAPGGKATGRPDRLIVTGSRLVARLGAIAFVDRQPREAVALAKGGQRLDRVEPVDRDPLERDVDALVGQRQLDVARRASAASSSPSKLAQRRDQREQPRVEDMAFEHVDDLVRPRGVEADQHAARPPCSARKRGAAAGARRREMRRRGFRSQGRAGRARRRSGWRNNRR